MFSKRTAGDFVFTALQRRSVAVGFFLLVCSLIVGLISSSGLRLYLYSTLPLVLLIFAIERAGSWQGGCLSVLLRALFQSVILTVVSSALALWVLDDSFALGQAQEFLLHSAPYAVLLHILLLGAKLLAAFNTLGLKFQGSVSVVLACSVLVGAAIARYKGLAIDEPSFFIESLDPVLGFWPGWANADGDLVIALPER